MEPLEQELLCGGMGCVEEWDDQYYQYSMFPSDAQMRILWALMDANWPVK